MTGVGNPTGQARDSIAADKSKPQDLLGGSIVQKFLVACVLAVALPLLAALPASSSAGQPATAAAATAAAPATTVPTSLAAGSKWRPPRAPVFNNPFGNKKQRFRIERRLVKAINLTPAGERIRISLYSFDRVDVAKAVIKARNRGVRVQILLNDHQVTKAIRMLRKRLGTNPKKRNFVYQCHYSCRGRRDNLHTKFFLFSQTGAAERVLMFGSVNFTLNAVKWQWNDLATVRSNNRAYEKFRRLFDDMRNDYESNQPFQTFCGRARDWRCNAITSQHFTRVFPRRSTANNDPVLNILKKVDCTYDTDNGMRRSHLKLSMHTMQGNRGEYIAEKIRQMHADGCDFKVIYGLMGWHVKKMLGEVTPRGRIPLRSTGFDYNGDGDVERYTHHKYLTLNGKYGGKRVDMVFTGSSNWSNRGQWGDEIITTMHGSNLRRRYVTNFDMMWNSDTYTRNAYTTTKSSYRTRSGKVVTVTTEENHPDRLGTGSPTWEAD